MAVPAYTLDNLPPGCLYTPLTRELMVRLPVPIEGKFHMLPIDRPAGDDAIFGVWHVNDDNVSVTNGIVSRRVDELVREYIDVLRLVVNVSDRRQKSTLEGSEKISPDRVKPEKYGKSCKLITVIISCMIFGALFSVTLLFIVIYYPKLVT